MVHYFNQRAIAFLQNQVFQARPFRINEDGTNSTLKGMISCFPSTVYPGDFIEEQACLLGALEDCSIPLRDILRKSGYPHTVSTSAYRLIPQTISSKTQAIAQAWASLPKYENDTTAMLVGRDKNSCIDMFLIAMSIFSQSCLVMSGTKPNCCSRTPSKLPTLRSAWCMRCLERLMSQSNAFRRLAFAFLRWPRLDFRVALWRCLPCVSAWVVASWVAAASLVVISSAAASAFCLIF